MNSETLATDILIEYDKLSKTAHLAKKYWAIESWFVETRLWRYLIAVLKWFSTAVKYFWGVNTKFYCDTDENVWKADVTQAIWISFLSKALRIKKYRVLFWFISHIFSLPWSEKISSTWYVSILERSHLSSALVERAFKGSLSVARLA